MSDIQGLFNLSNFEEAGENDLLNMSLNESAMTESANPEAAKKADDALRVEMNELTGLISDLRKLTEDEKMDENLKKILKAKIEFLDTKRMNILKACQNSIKESVEVTESTEIQDKCPSCNPEVEFDPSTKTNQEIPVPGGDKEQPSTSVKEQEIAVPGGDKEQPSSKPAGQTIPAANKVLLDSDTYNAALEQLQRSFKEAVDVLQTFKEATVIDVTPEEKYNQYMESVMDDAFVEYSAGPLFEKVDQEDKGDIKDIIEKVRKDLGKYISKNTKLYLPKSWARKVLGTNEGWPQLIQSRLWQVLGGVAIDDEKVDALLSEINKEFKEQLGGYKVIKFKAFPEIADPFRAKFKLDNGPIHMLIIDKKLPKEFSNAEKAAKKENK